MVISRQNWLEKDFKTLYSMQYFVFLMIKAVNPIVPVGYEIILLAVNVSHLHCTYMPTCSQLRQSCAVSQFPYRGNDRIFWIFPIVLCYAFCM